LIPKIYKVCEVAKMFLVDERIILREIKNKRLPCIILGERIVRIPQETVDSLKKHGITYYRENKRV